MSLGTGVGLVEYQLARSRSRCASQASPAWSGGNETSGSTPCSTQSGRASPRRSPSRPTTISDARRVVLELRELRRSLLPGGDPNPGGARTSPPAGTPTTTPRRPSSGTSVATPHVSGAVAAVTTSTQPRRDAGAGGGGAIVGRRNDRARDERGNRFAEPVAQHEIRIAAGVPTDLGNAVPGVHQVVARKLDDNSCACRGPPGADRRCAYQAMFRGTSPGGEDPASTSPSFGSSTDELPSIRR